MKKTTKVCLIAAFLVLLGCIAFVCTMSALKWNFTKLSTVEYKTNVTEITDSFSDISIISDTADIGFAFSDDEKCKVECREEKKAKHMISVENGTLNVKVNDRKSWYDYIGFRFGSQKVTVYLPKNEYNTLCVRESTGNIKIQNDFSFENVDISVSTGNVCFSAAAHEAAVIKTGTGDVRAENTSFGSLDISVTTGKVTVSNVNCKGDVTVGVSTGEAYLTDIACQNVISTGTTGSISMNRVIAANNFSIERSTGDVKFGDCDAAELHIKTTTGIVRGSLLTDKVFITDTKNGNVDVPKTANGGKCEIRTNTGDIKIKIA